MVLLPVDHDWWKRCWYGIIWPLPSTVGTAGSLQRERIWVSSFQNVRVNADGDIAIDEFLGRWVSNYHRQCRRHHHRHPEQWQFLGREYGCRRHHLDGCS